MNSLNSFDKEFKIRSRIEDELRNQNNSGIGQLNRKCKSIEAISLVSEDDLDQSKNFSRNKSIIPMISVVLNGGFDCLRIIKENLSKKVPTLLLAGSKGTADLICKIVNFKKDELE